MAQHGRVVLVVANALRVGSGSPAGNRYRHRGAAANGQLDFAREMISRDCFCNAAAHATHVPLNDWDMAEEKGRERERVRKRERERVREVVMGYTYLLQHSSNYVRFSQRFGGRSGFQFRASQMADRTLREAVASAATNRDGGGACVKSHRGSSGNGSAFVPGLAELETAELETAD